MDEKDEKANPDIKDRLAICKSKLIPAKPGEIRNPSGKNGTLSFSALRYLAQRIAQEVHTNSKGQAMTIAEHMLHKWAGSEKATLQIAFMEVAFGKVPQEHTVDVRTYDQRQAEDHNARLAEYHAAMARAGKPIIVDVQSRVIPQQQETGQDESAGQLGINATIDGIRPDGRGVGLDSEKPADDSQGRPDDDSADSEHPAEDIRSRNGQRPVGGQAADVSTTEIPAGGVVNVDSSAVILSDNSKS